MIGYIVHDQVEGVVFELVRWDLQLLKVAQQWEDSLK